MEHTRYYWSDTNNMFATYEEMVASAREKIAFINKDKFEGFVYGAGYIPITKGMAKEFYRDLYGPIYGSSSTNSKGTMNSNGIARYMGITESKANAYLYACADYGITEKQNGNWVV